MPGFLTPISPQVPQGLLIGSAIGQGLQNFAETFMKARQLRVQNDLAQKENQRKDDEYQLKLQESGRYKDPQTGELRYTPQGLLQNGLIRNPDSEGGIVPYRQMDTTDRYIPNEQAKQAAALKLAQEKSQLEEFSPESQAAQATVLKNAAKEMGIGVPQGISNTAFLKTAPLLEKTAAIISTKQARQRQIDEQAYRDSSDTFNKVHSDKEWQKYNGILNESDNLKNLVQDATSNPASANALGVFAARYATGGQRLNQAEIKALGSGSNAVMDKLKQIATTGAKGTITPENAAFMNQFIDVTSQMPRQQKEKIENDYADKFARGKHMDPNSARSLIFGDRSQGAQGLLPQAQSQTTGPHGATVFQNGHQYNWNPSTGKYE